MKSIKSMRQRGLFRHFRKLLDARLYAVFIFRDHRPEIASKISSEIGLENKLTYFVDFEIE